MWAHLVGPLGAQFVGGVVRAAAPEGVDNVAIGRGETGFAVVADVRRAGCGARLVAHDGLRERDEQGARVGRVQLGCSQGPLGAADHRFEVVGQVGRGCGEGLGEVEFQGAAGAGDRGGDGAVVVVAVGEPEGRLRDGHLGASGFGPAHVEVGAAVVLEVLDLDVVGRAGGQLDRGGGLFGVPVVDPVVDDELSADPEAEAVVADDREGVGAGLRRDDLAGPADADVVGPAGGEGEPGFEVVEVEVRVDAGGLEVGEVEGAWGGLGVVLALQAVDLGGGVGRGGARGGEGGKPGDAEGQGEQ